MEDPPLNPERLATLQNLGRERRDVLGELADLFLNQYPSRLEALCAALAAGDLTALRRAAHGFKGSCANLGADSLARYCGALEEAAEGGDLGACRTLLPTLEGELSRVCEALEQRLRERPGSPP